jgi:cadmium resistance protein CadD (predicted permease)
MENMEEKAIVIHPLRLKVSDQMIFIIICITFAFSGSSEIGVYTDMCL